MTARIILPPNGSGTELDTFDAGSGRAREVHVGGGDLLIKTSGTITAYSGFGAGTSTGISTAPAAGSTLVLTPTGTDASGATVQYDRPSWTVQITGTWVGMLTVEETLDGTTWVPVNSRQSAGGRLSNNFTVNGLFRGSYGGVGAVRVRSSAFTSGTAVVTLAIGSQAALFLNSDVLVQTEQQYYASSAGLNSMYGATSDVITFPTAVTDQSYFALYNTAPVGGVVLYIYRISLGSGLSSTMRRRRFTGAPTIGAGGASVTPDNRAGVANTPMGLCYSATLATGIVLPGTPKMQKALQVPASAQDTSTEEFSLLVPPGQGLAFSITTGNNGTASAEIVWSEGSTLT